MPRPQGQSMHDHHRKLLIIANLMLQFWLGDRSNPLILLHIFEHLQGCMCCYRHMGGFPVSVSSSEMTQVIASPERIARNRCTCSCRSISRTINQMYRRLTAEGGPICLEPDDCHWFSSWASDHPCLTGHPIIELAAHPH